MKQEDIFDEQYFVYGRELRAQFKADTLPRQWLKKYPQLFNNKDLALTEEGSSYLFFEWLGAILLYEASGYLSYHKWDCKNHPEKHALFRQLCDPEFAESVYGTSGTPDLFCVSPDKSSWFFCEVKGPSDKIRPHQKRIARKFLKRTGKRVMLLHFTPVD